MCVFVCVCLCTEWCVVCVGADWYECVCWGQTGVGEADWCVCVCVCVGGKTGVCLSVCGQSGVWCVWGGQTGVGEADWCVCVAHAQPGCDITEL